MHPDQTNATIEDLWPGDVIVARQPGRYYTSPHRFVDSRTGCGGVVIVKLASLEGDAEFEAVAMDGWKTTVERVA